MRAAHWLLQLEINRLESELARARAALKLVLDKASPIPSAEAGEEFVAWNIVLSRPEMGHARSAQKDAPTPQTTEAAS